MAKTVLDCLRGYSVRRSVLLGFAPARLLHGLSFADVLDEDAGRGYQRRFNPQHSLDFRRYVARDGSATIPLTFNLRPASAALWKITDGSGAKARLEIALGAGKVLSQVDCQHRLGHLADVDLDLPFMCFINLSALEEMEVFNVINGKAKGLSPSLLDFHDAQLATDLASDRPELYVALYLKNEPSSPWYKQLDLGGNATSGMERRASLRTLQKAIKVFLQRTKVLHAQSTDAAGRIILDFWAAVALVLPEAWARPRKHLLTKGLGVYALMELAADLFAEARSARIDRTYFAAGLASFAREFDWSNEGPLKGLGGQGGVKAAVAIIRDARAKARLRVVRNG